MSKETLSIIVNAFDEQGRPSKTKLQVDLDSTLAEIQAIWDTGADLFDNITNCGLKSAEVTVPLLTTGTSPVPAAGTNTSMDKLVWTWLDEDGNQFENQTPAPMGALMATDDYHVSDTNDDILAWIDYVETFLKSPYGKAVTGVIDVVRGWKNRKAKNV